MSEKNEKKKQDRELDEALEETFPGSDPVAVGSGITGDEEPPPLQKPAPPKPAGKKDEPSKPKP